MCSREPGESGVRRARTAIRQSAHILTAKCCLYRSNVDFLHRHHCVECPFGGCAIRTGNCFGQRNGRNLPGDAPLVLAPTALALFTAIMDDCIPVAIRLFLIFSGNLKREGFVMLERGSTVEPEARNA